MFKYDQSENPKSSKKQKEVKLLTNYNPLKKANAHSNISEYETESSIQKNFSCKCQKNKNHIQAKSVQTTHNNNHIIPNKCINSNKNENLNKRNNKSSRGSLYNLNNLNLGDYFSEKVIVTQQKFIDYKENKINTLQKELSLLKKEVNLYESKNIDNLNSTSKSRKIIGNNSKRNKSHSTDKNMNINMNINNNLKEITPKLHNDNKYNNKILLGNNKSYISFNSFYSNEIMNNKSELADKKLKKHLSSLLTETNVTNINIKTNKANITNNNVKHKNKYKKNKKNAEKDLNKKNLLNMIYLSKKGCYNHANNNYDHNTKIINININNTCTNNNKGKTEQNEIKHDLHFYAITKKERQTIIKENLQNKKGNKNDIRLRNDLNNLNDKINDVFNGFFDYYEKNKNKVK